MYLYSNENWYTEIFEDANYKFKVKIIVNKMADPI